MAKSKKQAIIDDLQRFSKAKHYYNKIGKPWKRGYLLYEPPGTGISTMIAAMANLLEYDVYDLELTAVKDYTQLRRLLTQTLTKSIIVIEEIDRSLNLTGQRSIKEKEVNSKDAGEAAKEAVKKKLKEEEDEKKSEVTLSGLINFIDGIWLACGEERLVAFTTNHNDKFDPALIRRGRMDMHIELSYCCYESFLVLAKNYLDIDEHPLFDEIKTLLSETNACPADVADNLMPKSLHVDDESIAEMCLRNLFIALERAKEDAKLKALEEENLKDVSEETKTKNDEVKQGSEENNEVGS